MKLQARGVHRAPAPRARLPPAAAGRAFGMDPVPCPAVPCHAKLCRAMPHRVTLTRDTLGKARAQHGLATMGRHPLGAHGAVEFFTGKPSSSCACKPRGEARTKSLFCTLWGSLGNTEARRYRFAGLCAKGFTVFIINTINRFVVLL